MNNERDTTAQNESEQTFLDLAKELGIRNIYREIDSDRLYFTLHYMVTSDDVERRKPRAVAFAAAMKELMDLEPAE